MENKVTLWPCVHCTKQEFEEQIKDTLIELGYDIDIDNHWDLFPVLQTCFDNKKWNTVGNYCELSMKTQYMCNTIEEFLEKVRNLAGKFNNFQEAATLLVKFLNENYYKNYKIIVTATGAELV